LGGGSGGRDGINGRRSDERTARSVNASLRIILEGLDDSDVDEEGNDDRDEDQDGEGNSDNTGQSHTDSEDELVADAVEEESEEDDHQDESGDQGHQDESLRGLGDVADVVRGLVVVEDGRRDGKSGDRGLNSVQVVVDLGLVDVAGLRGQSSGGSGSSGGTSGGDLEGLGELVPGSHGGGDHEGNDDTGEDNGAAIARSEGGGH